MRREERKDLYDMKVVMDMHRASQECSEMRRAEMFKDPRKRRKNQEKTSNP